METMNRTDPLPTDWNLWRSVWAEWLTDKRSTGQVRPTSWRFPGRNFLADEVLGTFSINGRNVELSEVTFPSLGERPARTIRYVGVTFGTGAEVDGGAVVSTLAELDKVLGL